MYGLARALALAALLVATAAHAQTVYKSIGPDGTVVYSDQPPADGKIDKIIEFPDLPSSAVPPLDVKPLAPGQAAALTPRMAIMATTPEGSRVVPQANPAQLSRRVSIPPQAQEPVRRPAPPVTLYSATWCGYCRRAKVYLADHGIVYFNVDIETRDGRAAFQTAGGGGIPLLTSGGKRVRGFKAEGYDRFFASR